MRWIAKLLVLLFISFTGSLTSVEAARKKVMKISDSNRYAAYVVDVESGEVLFARSAERKRHPASLTKMMTLYLTFEAIDNKKLRFNQKLLVSKRASSQPRGKLGLGVGEYITVKDAVDGTIVKSANDAAMVLAEKIGGSQKGFAKMMNQKARQLGMKHTHFTNPHGLHSPNQVTTAADMAKLGIALRKHFPQHYKLFSKNAFKFKGRIVYGHNHVMHRYAPADGLKTGYIRASGYNLVTSARKPQGSLVAVVLGGPSARMRDDHMIKILDYGYKRLEKKKAVMASKGKKPGTRVAELRNAKKAKVQAARGKATSVKPQKPVVKHRVAGTKKDVFSPVAGKSQVKTENGKKTLSSKKQVNLAKNHSKGVFSVVDGQKIAGKIGDEK